MKRIFFFLIVDLLGGMGGQVTGLKSGEGGRDAVPDYRGG